jgi:hypothetical protein
MTSLPARMTFSVQVPVLWLLLAGVGCAEIE